MTNEERIKQLHELVRLLAWENGEICRLHDAAVERAEKAEAELAEAVHGR